MRHVFLINPHAGKQDQTARIRALADRLAAAHNLDCRCLLTDRPGGAEVLSRALAEAGEPVRIYACGGGGTLNEVVSGMMELKKMELKKMIYKKKKLRM